MARPQMKQVPQSPALSRHEEGSFLTLMVVVLGTFIGILALIVITMM